MSIFRSIPGIRGKANMQAPKILLGWGDSLGVGIDARDPATDLNWPNVRQVRFRSPVGINSDITPLDQAIAPTGTDYLSSYEYFAKAWSEATGAVVYIVPHNYNGSSISSTGWGVGNTLHEAFIARANAAIQTVIAATPGSTEAEIVFCDFEASNDAATGSTGGTTYKTARLAAVNDIRSRIFKNGVSGVDTSGVPYIVNGMIPEYLSTTNRVAYEQTLRDIAASITNGKFYKLPEGIQRGDNLHPGVPGMRIIGPAAAALLSDTTPPVITGFAALGSYTLYENQNLLAELTVSGAEYAYWTLSGPDAASFEIYKDHDYFNGIGLSRMKQYIRVAADGTLAQGTKTITLTAMDGAGNTASQSLSITAIAAYGSSSGPTSVVLQQGLVPLTVNSVNERSALRYRCPVSLGAGMNVIHLTKGGGAASDVASLTFNGIVATRDSNSLTGNGPWIFYLPLAVAQSGDLIITPTSSSFTSLNASIVLLNGYAASPSSSGTLPYASRSNTSHQISLTCPAGGVIIGSGFAPGTITAVAGMTELYKSSPNFVGMRTTDGAIGENTSSTGYSMLSAAAFALA